MNRNLPPALRRSTAPAADSTAGTHRSAIPTDASSSSSPASQTPAAASAEPGTKPKFILHIAAPDLNTLRHLQGLGRITVWADHRTPADVEVRIRTIKDEGAVKLEALLDEVFPGWTYEEKP